MSKEEKTKGGRRSNVSKKRKGGRKMSSKEEPSANVPENSNAGPKDGSNKKNRSGGKGSDRQKKGSQRSGKKKTAVSNKKRNTKRSNREHSSVNPSPAKKVEPENAIIAKKPSSKRSSDEKARLEKKGSEVEIKARLERKGSEIKLGSPKEHEMEFSAMAPPKSLYLAAPMSQLVVNGSETALSKYTGLEPKKGKKQAAADWVAGVLWKGVDGVVEEYKGIKKDVSAEEYKEFSANDDHNRYYNTFCLDCSRVKIPPEDEYIHANYVGALEDKRKQFICAQGPMEKTADRFWRMVVVEEVPIIVMLCETVEKGEEKCFEYFPKEVGQSLTFGGITITNVEQTEFDPAKPIVVTSRLFEVEVEDRKTSVLHLHWRSWPDHGVPDNYTAPMRIVSRIKGFQKPIVIHCSAGIGRTGTLVLIGLAHGSMLSEQFTGMSNLLTKIREQRAGAVQNENQYLYAHRCLIEYLAEKNIVEKNDALEKFIKDYDEKTRPCKKKRPSKRDGHEKS